MKVNMTQNKNIRTFLDISGHLKLRDEHLEATKLCVDAYVVKSNSKKFSSYKEKWHKFRKGKEIIQGAMNKNKQFKCKKVRTLEREMRPN